MRRFAGKPCLGVSKGNVERWGASLLDERDFLTVTQGFVDHDQFAAIAGLELLVRVEQLDAIDGAIWRQIDVAGSLI